MVLIARHNKEINIRVAGRSKNLGGQTEKEGHLEQGQGAFTYDVRFQVGKYTKQVGQAVSTAGQTLDFITDP